MKNGFPMLALCGWLAAGAAGCATRRGSHAVIAEALKVSPQERLDFVAHAKGVQIYECRTRKEDATQNEWVLKAPEADLFDRHGKRIGHHFAGPTWEMDDGSRVVGEVRVREPAPNPDAIPWLLLEAKKHEGSGILARVSHIQRLETIGGKAPEGGCELSNTGLELRVPYTAEYYFYTLKK